VEESFDAASAGIGAELFREPDPRLADHQDLHLRGYTRNTFMTSSPR
jgi:hypothetical protein